MFCYVFTLVKTLYSHDSTIFKIIIAPIFAILEKRMLLKNRLQLRKIHKKKVFYLFCKNFYKII